MDKKINSNSEDNKSYSKIRFLAYTFIGKNCEFINCEFEHGCVIKESCKFTNCTFDKCCNFARGGTFARGCEFVQCTFDNILISKMIY